MILFAPNYDPATAANFSVAEQLAVGTTIALLGARATREELLVTLQKDGSPLFVMSHGKPRYFVGHQGQPALGEADVSGLNARPVFAFACHTATHLGARAAERGSVWWGYTGAIQCPDCPKLFLPCFINLFRFIAKSFADAADKNARDTVMLRIGKMCAEMEAELDNMALNDPDLDVGAAYLCLLHIWDRLRVWVPGAAVPLHHPRASPPSLFLDA